MNDEIRDKVSQHLWDARWELNHVIGWTDSAWDCKVMVETIDRIDEALKLMDPDYDSGKFHHRWLKGDTLHVDDKLCPYCGRLKNSPICQKSHP